MARRSSDIIVGLDIGTTKIAAIVAEIVESGLDVIGIGTHVSRGLKKGVIVNIDSTVAAIKQAVLEAEACPVARFRRSTWGSRAATSRA